MKKQNTIIKIQNLSFDYTRGTDQETVRALDRISLEIEKGSFVAVIGRNGSGKSTLAKNINSLLIPTEGLVYVDGYDTNDKSAVWEIRQRAGMVFQNPDNQLVSAIVEDDVAFGPENIGIPPEEIMQRVNDSLRAVDMYDNRGKAPHLLSGGQKQRIAIAGVIAMRPEIIIFDEPTAMLDPKGREDIKRIIRQLHDEGITVLLITHFMEETTDTDRIIIMDRGRVALDGSPEEVFRKHEKIKELDLELPQTVELATRLRQKGLDIPDSVLTPEALKECLCHMQ
jgi:energy-coupling factor transport system ATP-binding protein